MLAHVMVLALVKDKNLQQNFLDWRTTLPLFRKFSKEKCSFGTQKSATKFFGSEMTTPALGSFPKIHPKWSREASLRPYQCNCNAQIKIPPNCLLQSYPKSCSLEPCVVSDLTLLGYCIHIKVCPCCELTVALCCQTICVALCSSRFPL